MDALKHLLWGEFLNYSLAIQDSQCLGCQATSENNEQNKSIIS